MSSRLGLSIVLKRLLMVAILAGVFGVSAGAVMYLALRGRTVEVPNVLGKTETEAETELDGAGLKMKVKNREHNNRYPQNAVSDQSPPPGTTVKSGQLVRVSVSLGAAPAAQRGN